MDNNFFNGSGIRSRGGYTFRLGGIKGRELIAINNGKSWETYSADTLRFMSSSSGLPDPVRDMARAALEEFDLLEEPKKKEEQESTIHKYGVTLANVSGTKIYQEFTRLRRFFAKVGSAVIYRDSLSEIEREIKGE